MLRAIVFDFDGVLVDSELLHFQAFNNIFRPLHVEMSIQQYYDKFLGLTDEELLRLLDKQNNLRLSEQRLQKLLKEKAAEFKELALTQATVIAGVPEFLKMLADNKIPMAVCSGALLPEIEMILKGAGLRHFFDVIVSAEQVKKGKPDPEGFLLALKLLNKKTSQPINPQDCIVIEDSHWGLEAARAAGMHPIAVTNSYSADQLKPSDRTVANLNQLTLEDLCSLCA
ncbi:MAG: HAD family phosphatase [Sedimentisphaerales bacterium]|jgi:beta-phosphoglucomutase family hydrolase